MKKFLLTFALILLSLTASADLKYVFLFIGDGMGMGHVMAAETYNRRVLGSPDNILMMQFPVSSFALTYSANSSITDSAAAGTALATGIKTNNSMIGMNADTVAVESVATQLKRQGWGVGIITSVAFDDATPAAHFAHQPHRKMWKEINHDGARSNFDFIGGMYTLMARNGEDACNKVFDDYRANGYNVVSGMDALKKAVGGKKILASFGSPSKSTDFPYTIDSIPGAPTLRQLTAECLQHMIAVSPDHFFMMVEGGNIDHAAHANDGATVVKEVLNFQESIRVAYDFYVQHPDETLIVITADHDTGGMTIGVDKGNNNPTFADIDWRRMSKGRFQDYCTQHTDLTWDAVKEVMADNLGLWSHIPVSESEEAALKASFNEFKNNAAATDKTLYKDFSRFSSDVFSLVNRKNGIGFTTYSHTGNPVPVFAVGKGCELFSEINNNIEIPRRFRKLLNLEEK
jgi:alkaline phosphatase